MTISLSRPFGHSVLYTLCTCASLALLSPSVNAQTTETFAGPTIDPRLKFDFLGYGAAGTGTNAPSNIWGRRLLPYASRS
jgi:hypothetical protein